MKARLYFQKWRPYLAYLSCIHIPMTGFILFSIYIIGCKLFARFTAQPLPTVTSLKHVMRQQHFVHAVILLTIGDEKSKSYTMSDKQQCFKLMHCTSPCFLALLINVLFSDPSLITVT